MPARYTFSADWDDDGDFDSPDEDLTRDVIAARWALGLDQPGDSVAAPSWAEVTLRDRARRYTPDNADGPLFGKLTPQKKVRIRAACGGETRTLFTGWTESFTPRADGTVSVRCAGVEALLKRAQVFPAPEAVRTADQVIDAALRQVSYPPALSGYWVLGRSRLGVSTRLADTSVYRLLEPGISRFTYGGRPGSAWDAIREVVEAERGLCFVDREGRVIFWNRHHLAKVVEVSAALTAREAAFEVSGGAAGMVNHAAVTCYPRTVGTSPQALWTLQSPLALPPGSARTVRAHFGDGSGAVIEGRDLVLPAAGTDYHASSAPDGSGQDCTALVSAALEASTRSARITFTSAAPITVYVLAGAQVRGITLARRDPLDVEAEDAESITRYGRRTLRLDLPPLSDTDDADRLARALVGSGKMPRAAAERAALCSDSGPDVLATILGRTIGDRVRLSDPRSAHAAEYHLVGEQHSLDRGGTVHAVAWVLRPAPAAAFWRLGVARAGELGTSTRIGY